MVDSVADLEDVDQLRAVNQAMLHQKARTESPRQVWLDMDDTVMTVFGAQQGAEDGYNPRYHGRPSYKAKVAFVAGSGELVNAGLYGGKTASNGEFLPFFQETLTLLPPRTVVEGVRMDKGLVPLKDSIRKIIAYLDEQKAWRRLDDTYAVAEIRIPLPSWDRARRFVFVRETLKPVAVSQQMALAIPAYDYEVMVTNREDLAPAEVWRLAYNLLNWFRLALLPEGASHHEALTIRRRILNVPGNVVGNGRRRTYGGFGWFCRYTSFQRAYEAR